MILREAINKTTDSIARYVIEDDGNFISVTQNILDDPISKIVEDNKILEHYQYREVSFIHYNKAVGCIEYGCYLI